MYDCDMDAKLNVASADVVVGDVLVKLSTIEHYSSNAVNSGVPFLNISAGKFGAITDDAGTATNAKTPEKAITGGTFTAAVPLEYCDAGFHPVENEEGNYSVEQHQLVDVAAKAATCTEGGWAAYSICNCGYETDHATYPATGHNWVYTASGAVITATCANDATHTATATLTIASGTIAYDRNPKTPASVVYSENWPADKNYEVEYSNNTNAGTASASVTIEGAIAAANFTIAKANPEVGTVSQTGALYSTNTLAQAAEALNKTGTTEGSFTLNGKTPLETGTYNWTFTPNDTTNYNTASGTVTLTITEDALSSIVITTKPTKTEYTYGDALDMTGMVVKATYASGTVNENYTAYTVSPTTANSVEELVAITVTSTEDGTKTDTFNVKVDKANYTGVTVTASGTIDIANTC